MDINSVSLDSSNSSDDDDDSLFLDDGDAIGGGDSSVSDLGDFEIPSYDLGLSLFQNPSDDVTSHGDFQMPSSHVAPPFSNPNNNGQQDFVPNGSPAINLPGLSLSPNPSLVPNQGGLNLDSSQSSVQTPPAHSLGSGFQFPFGLTDGNHGVPPDSYALNVDDLQAPQYNGVGNFVTNPPNNPFGYGFDMNTALPSDNSNGGGGFMNNNNPLAPSLLMQNPSSFHGFNDPMMMTNDVSQSGTDLLPSHGLPMPYTNYHNPEGTWIHLDPFLRKRIFLNIPAPAPLPEIGLGRRMIPYPIELLETMHPPQLPPPAAAPADADATPPNPEQMDQNGAGAGDGDEDGGGDKDSGGSGDGNNGPPEKIGLLFYFDEQLDKLSLSNDAPRQPIGVARIDTPEVLEAIERDDPDLYDRMYRDTRKRKNSPSPLDLPPEKRGGGGGGSASGNNQFQNPGIGPAGGGGGVTGGFYHL